MRRSPHPLSAKGYTTVRKKLRFEVFKRDRFTYTYCGRRPPDVTLEADHVVPVCEGGSDDLANLTTSCFDCNRGKAGFLLGNVAPVVDEMEVMRSTQEMAERTRALKQRAASTTELREAMDAAIEIVVKLLDEIGLQYYQRQSLRKFLELLDLATLEEATNALNDWWDDRSDKSQSDAWRYFCGINWTIVRQKELGDVRQAFR